MKIHHHFSVGLEIQGSKLPLSHDLTNPACLVLLEPLWNLTLGPSVCYPLVDQLGCLSCPWAGHQASRLARSHICLSFAAWGALERRDISSKDNLLCTETVAWDLLDPRAHSQPQGSFTVQIWTPNVLPQVDDVLSVEGSRAVMLPPVRAVGLPWGWVWRMQEKREPRRRGKGC